MVILTESLVYPSQEQTERMAMSLQDEEVARTIQAKEDHKW